MDHSTIEADGEPGNIEATNRIDAVENRVEMPCQHNEENNTIAYLSKTLEQKDDLIKLLLKEKGILECEKKLLQKEQQTALKDKESIVMRFAIVEKNLIDLKSQLEQADKREKKMHKEFDMLNDKLKTVKDDKTRISTALDVKTQEHKNSLKDIEKLKIDISSLETKCKWNTVKLRQEIETKNVLEKELQELKNAEINTKTESEDFSVEKIAELKASQITLKHVNLEQANKISIIEQRLENTSKEMHAMRLLLADCTQEKGNLNDELQECHLENLKLQNVVDANVLKIAELQSNLNDLAALRAQLSIANDTNKHLEDQLRSIEIQLSDQAADVARFHQRESELLTLNGELSALNATLQNEISLHKSKSLAMSLENDSVKKTRMDFEINITKLQAELDHERRSRADERIMMARHLAEKSKDCDHYQQRLDQVLGDLEVVKKKNASIVKTPFHFPKLRTSRKLINPLIIRMAGATCGTPV